MRISQLQALGLINTKRKTNGCWPNLRASTHPHRHLQLQSGVHPRPRRIPRCGFASYHWHTLYTACHLVTDTRKQPKAKLSRRRTMQQDGVNLLLEVGQQWLERCRGHATGSTATVWQHHLLTRCRTRLNRSPSRSGLREDGRHAGYSCFMIT